MDIDPDQSACQGSQAFEAQNSRSLRDFMRTESMSAGMLVAAARVNAARTALDVTQQVFELMGARATTRSAGLDRYWRNVRVHTLHDPLDYRSKDIGRWLLTGELPNPYGYG